MKNMFLFGSLFFFIMACATASAGNLPPLPMEIRLSETSIIAGQPIGVIIRVTNNTPEERHVYVANNFRFGKKWFVLHLEGPTPIARRQLLVYPTPQNCMGSKFLKSNESTEAYYPLHLQYTTDLPPGKYQLSVEKSEESIYWDGVFTNSMMNFEVRPYDGKALRDIYANLLKESLAAYPGVYANGFALKEEFTALPPCMKLLLWAWGKDAIPYQIDLLFSPEGVARISETQAIHTYQNIVENGTKEDVERLVAIAKQDKFSPKYEQVRYYDPVLVWALNQIHQKDDPELKKMTEDIVLHLPAPDNIHVLESPCYFMR